MRVTFSGIKNIQGGYSIQPQKQIDENHFFPESHKATLSFELDNEDTPDLDEFRPLLKKYPVHPMQGDTITITFDRNISRLSEKDEPWEQNILLINQGALLNPKEDSLPILSIIAKLAKKIENIKPQDLRTAPERLEYSEEVEKKRQEWEDIDKKMGTDGRLFVDKDYRYHYVNKAATLMCENIEKAVNDILDK